MVDYTTKTSSSGWGAGFYLAAAFIVAMLLYGMFAGGGPRELAPTDIGTEPAAPTISE